MKGPTGIIGLSGKEKKGIKAKEEIVILCFRKMML